jgi:hypothetical protein
MMMTALAAHCQGLIGFLLRERLRLGFGVRLLFDGL